MVQFFRNELRSVIYAVVSVSVFNKDAVEFCEPSWMVSGSFQLDLAQHSGTKRPAVAFFTFAAVHPLSLPSTSSTIGHHLHIFLPHTIFLM